MQADTVGRVAGGVKDAQSDLADSQLVFFRQRLGWMQKTDNSTAFKNFKAGRVAER